MPPRRQKGVGQRSVIGEQEQPLGVLVQPPHGKQRPPPQMLGQQVQHRPLPGVLGGGDHPGGLVEHHINPLLRGNGPAIHCDGGAFGHLVLRSLGPGAPYLDPARLDQRLGLFPGPLARGRQQLVQPLHGLSPPVPVVFAIVSYFFRRGHRVRRRFSPPVPFPGRRRRTERSYHP